MDIANGWGKGLERGIGMGTGGIGGDGMEGKSIWNDSWSVGHLWEELET